MKTLSILGLFILISNQCFTQSLEGEWHGSFTTNDNDSKVPIALHFASTKDSSYIVYSYSEGSDYLGNKFTMVCQVLYKKISNDSIHLEEVKQIKPKKTLLNCFQEMYLKININEKGDISLEGKWEVISKKECANSSGTISFKKKY